MEYLFTMLIVCAAIILSIVGIAGCVLPILPGPLISFAALLLIRFTTDIAISTEVLIFFGAATLLVTLIDNLLPIFMPFKFGSSGWGIFGAGCGFLLGLFFPPLGFIIGAFIGAIVMELLKKGMLGEALVAGIGSFIGFMVGTIAKVALSMAITGWLIVKALKPLL